MHITGRHRYQAAARFHARLLRSYGYQASVRRDRPRDGWLTMTRIAVNPVLALVAGSGATTYEPQTTCPTDYPEQPF